MMKKIYAIMLMAVLIVVGLSAANAQTPTEKAVKPLNNFDRKTESENLLSAKLTGDGAAMKTELANLKTLIQKAPCDVPQDVLSDQIHRQANFE